MLRVISRIMRWSTSTRYASSVEDAESLFLRNEQIRILHYSYRTRFVASSDHMKQSRTIQTASRVEHR
jgi:hypothetical protein